MLRVNTVKDNIIRARMFKEEEVSMANTIKDKALKASIIKSS